jgi:hypothetical protein
VHSFIITPFVLITFFKTFQLWATDHCQLVCLKYRSRVPHFSTNVSISIHKSYALLEQTGRCSCWNYHLCGGGGSVSPYFCSLLCSQKVVHVISWTFWRSTQHRYKKNQNMIHMSISWSRIMHFHALHNALKHKKKKISITETE